MSKGRPWASLGLEKYALWLPFRMTKPGLDANILGVVSPFFSTIVLSKTGSVFPGFPEVF